MINIIKKHWPLIISLLFFWIIVIILLVISIKQNQGYLVYALDDPYIHMAIAKNFALNKVWGINNEFSSSSSSPLWTLILSLIYSLFRVNEISPFILNIIFGSLIIFEVYYLLRKYKLNQFFIFIVLLSIIFFTPFHSLIFSGQEHTMHIFFTIPFVYLSSEILTNKKISNRKNMLTLLLASLVTITRYEGLFLVFVIYLLFILKREILNSVYLILSGIFPIVMYGIISVINGWLFLPNSILLKGNIPEISLEGISNFLYHFFRQIINPSFFALILLASILIILEFNKQKTIWKQSTIMLIIFISTTLLHLLFSYAGAFFRYEAYLIALGIFVISIGLYGYLPKKVSIKFDKNLKYKYLTIIFLSIFIIFTFSPTFIIFSPLVKRGVESLAKTPQATNNIYEQQYQMALFLKKYYHNKCVAANDIGAISYMANIKCVDLWGLANLKVASLKRMGKYNSRQIYEIGKQEEVEIVIVYDDWFIDYGKIPPQWIKAGEWKISNNVVCWSDTVSFYAVNQSEVDNLIKNLKDFSSYLPKDVEQNIEIIK